MTSIDINYLKKRRLECTNKELLKDIKSFLSKKKKLNEDERFELSVLYLSLSDSIKALSILHISSPPSYTEIINMGDGQRKLVLRYVTLIEYLGARYLSTYLLQQFEKLDQEKGLSSELKKLFLRTQATVHYKSYNYDRALTSYQKLRAFYSPEDYVWQIANLGISDCHAGNGNYSIAIKNLSDNIQDASSYFVDIYHEAISEFLYKNGDLDLAITGLQAVVKKDQSLSKEGYFNRLWLGASFLKKGDNEKAQEIFINLLTDLKELDSENILKSLILFFSSQVDGIDLTFHDKIFLYTNFQFSFIGAFLKGKNIPKAPHWTRELQLTPLAITSDSCWVITNTGIYIKNYWNNFSFEKYIDLQSGVVSSETKPVIMTELNVKCLHAIISTAKEGVLDIALADFVYQEDFLHFEDILNKLKGQIKRLKAYGIPIYQKKRRYYIDFSLMEYNIIMPLSIIYKIHPLLYLKNQPESFSLNDLSEAFNVSRPTANRYLKDGLESGIIELTDYNLYRVKRSK